MSNQANSQRALSLKLVVTDCDGCLTDSGVIYTESGELGKRFSIRDGMGVERLQKIAQIETVIMTGERSGSVAARAKKLKIRALLGIKDKKSELEQLVKEKSLSLSEVAFFGDDVNDLEALQIVGLAGCPNDAVSQVRDVAHFRTDAKGGHGAFREFAEFILKSRS